MRKPTAYPSSQNLLPQAQNIGVGMAKTRRAKPKVHGTVDETATLEALQAQQALTQPFQTERAELK